MEWTRHGRAAMMLAATLVVAAGPAAAERLFSLADVRVTTTAAACSSTRTAPTCRRATSISRRSPPSSAPTASGSRWRWPADPQAAAGARRDRVPVERIARNGFYTFNVDIYVDQDRIVGAGHTDALPDAASPSTAPTPGEGDRAHARPETARVMLQSYYDRVLEEELRAKQGKVSRKELDALETDAEKYVDERYFFPDEVRVTVAGSSSGCRPSSSARAEPSGPTRCSSPPRTSSRPPCEPVEPGKASMMTMGVGRGMRSDLWAFAPTTTRARRPSSTCSPPIAGRRHGCSATTTPFRRQPPCRDSRRTAASRSRPAKFSSRPSRHSAWMRRLHAANRRMAPSLLRRPREARRTCPPANPEPAARGRLITQAEYDELRRKILTEL